MNVPAPRPSHDAIARRAYDLYLERGPSGGDPIHDWLRAEAELSAELSATSREQAEAAPPASVIATKRPRRQAAPRKPRARATAAKATPAASKPPAGVLSDSPREPARTRRGRGSV